MGDRLPLFHSADRSNPTASRPARPTGGVARRRSGSVLGMKKLLPLVLVLLGGTAVYLYLTRRTKPTKPTLPTVETKPTLPTLPTLPDLPGSDDSVARDEPATA